MLCTNTETSLLWLSRCDGPTVVFVRERVIYIYREAPPGGVQTRKHSCFGHNSQNPAEWLSGFTYKNIVNQGRRQGCASVTILEAPHLIKMKSAPPGANTGACKWGAFSPLCFCRFL